MKRLIFIALSFLIVSIGVVLGQEEEKIIEAKVLGATEKLTPGGNNRFAVEIQINEPWHVNGNVVADDFLIPTVIEFNGVEGLSFSEIQYPAAEEKTFAFSENPVLVYEGVVYVYTTVSVGSGLAGKDVTISGVVSYQACNDETCLAPNDIGFSKTFSVAGKDEPVKEITEKIFGAARPPAPPIERGIGGGDLAQTIESRGLFLTFLVIFVAGLALNLTPCVYPLIPITISYFGGQAGGKKSSLFLLSLIYVLGMAITYSILGVFAALTGSILGAWLQNPWVLIFIAAVMVTLALSMFGLYEIRVPAGLANFAGQSKQGYFGTLFMGLTVGIIAAPCIGPFVLGLFTYVGEKGDPVMGFMMFFVLAVGLGIPFIFLALFSGAVNLMPRSGGWMIWVRKIFGFILVGMAFYFLNPLFESDLWYYTLLGITGLVAGIYLAWIDNTQGRGGKAFPIVKNVVGILFIIAGAFFWVNSVEAYVDERLRDFSKSAGESGAYTVNEIEWEFYSDRILQSAQESGKPVMIDFYADWCIPCKELDKLTFSDERVIELSKNFVMLKADLTKSESPEVQALQERYNIKGVPTLIFITSNGSEVSQARVVSYVNADKFLSVMQSVWEKEKNSDDSIVRNE
jgi:thiol:disulfide interchange protein DsbD